MEPESKLERILSHQITAVAAQSLSIFGSTFTPLAGLLPTLVEGLASGRQTTRIEQNLIELETRLKALEVKACEFTENQVKLVSDTITVTCSTINEDKLDYLKQAIENIAIDASIADDSEYLLSRIIRDISPNEIKFILKYRNFDKFVITDKDGTAGDSVLVTSPGTPEDAGIASLVNLGILYSRFSGYGGGHVYTWAPIYPKLIRLFTPSKSN